MDDGNNRAIGAETNSYDNFELDVVDSCAPATPLNKHVERPSPFTTVVVISDADELTAAEEWKTAEKPLHSFLSEPVSKLSNEEPCHKTQHTHNSKQSRRHKHEAAASSSQSPAESVTVRSHSYCSGWVSNSSCSEVSTASSSNGSSSSHAEHRAKSFTVGQQQQHRHRLAASSAARSSSPPGTGNPQPTSKRCNHSHSGACALAASAAHSCSGCCSSGSKQAPHRQRPASCAGAWGQGFGSGLLLQGREGSISISQSGGSGTLGKLVGRTTYAGGYAAGDVRLLSSSPGGLPIRGLLMAESVGVEGIGKGFQPHWYTNRVLQVYDGTVPEDAVLLLKQVPQQPGLHLWLVKPPCSRTWVPVRLDAADNLQETLFQYLHTDGSCGPPGSKQRVLLDLQCRGFAVQIRWRPLKPSSGTVQQDLLTKLQRFDFALNDTNNNGCRPIELPDGRPVHSYPLVVGHMMRLFEQLFVQPKFA